MEISNKLNDIQKLISLKNNLDHYSEWMKFYLKDENYTSAIDYLKDLGVTIKLCKGTIIDTTTYEKIFKKYHDKIEKAVNKDLGIK